MHDPMKHSDHIISIVSQVRSLSRNGPLQLDEESVVGLLQDLENAFRRGLELEEELESLCKVRDFIMSVSKTDIRFTHPETHRAAFSVVGGTAATTPRPKKETGHGR